MKPVARCAVSPAHTHPLVFSQPNPYGSEWECSCPDCWDGEPDGETGRMMRLDTAGWGKTPEEALADYAEQNETDAASLLLDPQPLPKPSVRRWDPIAGYWVTCTIENEKAWCPQQGTYTGVRPEELEPETEREP